MFLFRIFQILNSTKKNPPVGPFLVLFLLKSVSVSLRAAGDIPLSAASFPSSSSCMHSLMHECMHESKGI